MADHMTPNPTAADITFRDLAALAWLRGRTPDEVASAAIIAAHNDRNVESVLSQRAFMQADAMVKERARRMETSEDACVCVDDGCCDAISEAYHVCTRPKGHDGSHVACGSVDHRLEIWEDDQ